jgi:TonB family protein
MVTRAFMLCGDEKAVHAVTQILDELEVCFEHSSEPPFSLKRLATQRFDLLIVDCDNAQNATQVFNSARASSLNKNSIAVAIVEGKAGVPNAFRLGASLVLTKPVSLEQARNTLRTGIGMTRKDSPELRPLAAATPASTSSLPLTPVPAVAIPTKPGAAPVASPGSQPSPIAHTPVAQVPGGQTTTSLPAVPSTNRPEATPRPPVVTTPVAEKPLLVPRPVSIPSKVAQEHKPALTNFTDPKSRPTSETSPPKKAAAAGAAPAGASKVDSMLWRKAPAEPETSVPRSVSMPQPAERRKQIQPVREDEDWLAGDDEDALDGLRDRGVPCFGGMGKQSLAEMDWPRERGGKGFLIAVLVLLVMGGGSYAAWLTQPLFRDLMTSEYGIAQNKIASLRGLPQATVTAKAEAAPVVPTLVASRPQTGGVSTAGSTDAEALMGNLGASGGASPEQDADAAAQASDSAAADGGAKATSVPTAKQDTTTNPSNANRALVPASLPALTDAKAGDLLEVPEEYADDQIIHRVHPVYPRHARLKQLHGVVVLQAVVNKQGKVDSLQLISGDPLLAQAAADAVKQWRYKPYSRHGEAVDFQTRVTLDFELP